MTDSWGGKDASDLYDQELTKSVEQLASSSRPRAVEIANEVLARALRSNRHSLPIRAHASWNFVHVSDQVLIAKIRARIDNDLAGAAAGRVRLQVDRSETLRSITVELFVQYGHILVDVGDQARAITTQVLDRTLGRADVAILVTPAHVHISDVTMGDPRLMDPEADRS